jgi:XapX domain-containing protein
MTKTLLGLILGLLIGAGCRWFDVPVPSPPKLLGALLVVAMTVGYMAADRVLDRKVTSQRATLPTHGDGSASAAFSLSQK